MSKRTISLLGISLLGAACVAEEPLAPTAAPARPLDPALAERDVRYVVATGEVQRMTAATPAPAAAPGAIEVSPPSFGELGPPAASKIWGADERVQVGSTLDFPARAVVKIYMTWNGKGTWECSGTLIGRKYVLTAGHCIHNEDRGWADSVRVVPGLDGSYAPFGQAYAVHYDSVEGWTEDHNNDHDFAMLTLDRNLGDATGWLGLASLSDGNLDGLSVAVQGYPGERDGGVKQYLDHDPVQTYDSTMIYYDVDTTPGTSGGTLRGSSRYAHNIFGVHTGSSWFWAHEYNRATRINSSRYSQINRWMSDRAGLGTVSGNFEGWTSVGGQIHTTPTLVSWGGGRIDAFARGTDGAVWHKFRASPASGWSPGPADWEYLGGQITDSVAAVSRASNQLDLFVRGSDGGLWTKALNGTTYWPAGTGWYPLGGNLTGTPVAVSNAWNRLDVFARDAGGGLLWWQWRGSGWTGPTNLGGNITHNVAAVARGASHVDVIVRDVGGSYFHRGLDGAAWGGWTNLGGYLGGSPSLVAPSPGVLEVFGRDGGAGVWHQRFEGGWRGWEYLGGNITGDVAAVSRASGWVDLFVRDAGGGVFTKSLNGASTWWPGVQDWAWLGGDMLDTPVVVSTAWNRLDVLARGYENGVKLRSWNGSSW